MIQNRLSKDIPWYACSEQPAIKYVADLPDLITQEDKLDTGPAQKKVRIRIQSTDKGVEIIGDSMYDYVLEPLLARAGAKEIEKTLCG